MTAARLISATCVACGTVFEYEYRGGRRRVTCSDACKAARDNESKRVNREAETPEYPLSIPRPSVSEDGQPMSVADLDAVNLASDHFYRWDLLRQGRGSYRRPEAEKVDGRSDVQRRPPHDLGTFTMADFIDYDPRPLGAIPVHKRPAVELWLSANRVPKSVVAVGRTNDNLRYVIGSATDTAPTVRARIRDVTADGRPLLPLVPFVLVI